MGYIKSWTDYETVSGHGSVAYSRELMSPGCNAIICQIPKSSQSTNSRLVSHSNKQVRYCVKFKPKTGQLVLRLTDDTTVRSACVTRDICSSVVYNVQDFFGNHIE